MGYRPELIRRMPTQESGSDVEVTVLRCFHTDEVLPDPPVTAKYSGPCPLFEVGQKYLVKGDAPPVIPEGFCSLAWDAIIWGIVVLRSHGDFADWYEEPGVGIWACPDGLRPVIFDIRRTEETESELS